MNYFDLIFACIFVYAAYKGFSKGIVIQAASLIALIVGIYGAIKFSDITASFLINKFELQTQYLSLVAFAVTFIGIVIGIHFIARVVDKLLKAVALGFINRIFGLTFSIIKTAFIVSIILVIINNTDSKFNFLPKDKVETSILYKPITNFAPYLFPYLNFENIRNTVKDKIELPKIDIEQYNGQQT